MLLSEFRTAISGEIGLSTTSARELAVMDKAANEAVREFLRLTKCYVRPFEMTLTADEGNYDLPTSVIALKTLYVVSATSPGVEPPLLEPTSSADIIRRRRFPVGGAVPQVYALEGANLLMIHPSAASSSDKLDGLYVPRPTKMTAPTHDSSNTTYGGVPEEFDPALEAYAKWKTAEWDDDTSSQDGLSYKAEWLERLKEAKISLNRKAGVRWGPARPKRRRGYVPRSPGVDRGW